MHSVNTEGALAPGTRLHDYVIEEVIGRGGFGITYKGFHAKLNFPVALKEYMPESFSARGVNGQVVPFADQKNSELFKYGLDRFLFEAKDLIRFDHPNIVHARNYFEENGTAYIVMDYAEGQTLTDWLKELDDVNQVPSEAALQEIFLQVLDGLKEVHEKGLLHRDIKADNIYLQEDGPPMLIDFGSARNALGTQSRSLNVIVSPGYSPKEQYAMHGKQGPWTDIYSVGASLWYSLCLRVPLESTLRADLKDHGEPDKQGFAYQKFAGRYSEQFLKTIDWCLCLQASERPQNVDYVRDCLYRIQDPPESVFPVQSDGFEIPVAEPYGAAYEGIGDSTMSEWIRRGDTVVKSDDGSEYNKSNGTQPKPAKSASSRFVPVSVGILTLVLLLVGGYFGWEKYSSNQSPVVTVVFQSTSESIEFEPSSEPDSQTSDLLLDRRYELATQNSNRIERLGVALSAEQKLALAERFTSSKHSASQGSIDKALETINLLVEDQQKYLDGYSRNFRFGSSDEDIQHAQELCVSELGELDAKTNLPNCPRRLFDLEKGGRVQLTPYMIDSAEVSFEEFSVFVEKTGYVTNAESRKWSLLEVPDSGEIVKLEEFDWRNPLGPTGGNHKDYSDYPVVHVSYDDAREYCAYLGKRLPTRAEWEHAVSASGQLKFGQYFDPASRVIPEDLLSFSGLLWVDSAKLYDSTSELYGGTGNVREWSDTPNPATHNSRYTKGGSWLSSTSAFLRVSALKSEFKKDSFIDLGFRCAVDTMVWPQ